MPQAACETHAGAFTLGFLNASASVRCQIQQKAACRVSRRNDGDVASQGTRKQSRNFTRKDERRSPRLRGDRPARLRRASKIAERISVSVHTMRSQMQSAMKKLDMDDRTQLALWGARNHLGRGAGSLI